MSELRAPDGATVLVSDGQVVQDPSTSPRARLRAKVLPVLRAELDDEAYFAAVATVLRAERLTDLPAWVRSLVLAAERA